MSHDDFTFTSIKFDISSYRKLSCYKVLLNQHTFFETDVQEFSQCSPWILFAWSCLAPAVGGGARRDACHLGQLSLAPTVLSVCFFTTRRKLPGFLLLYMAALLRRQSVQRGTFLQPGIWLLTWTNRQMTGLQKTELSSRPYLAPTLLPVR